MDFLNIHLFVFAGFLARIIKYWQFGDFQSGKVTGKKLLFGFFLVIITYLACSVVNMNMYYKTPGRTLIAIFVYVMTAFGIDSVFGTAYDFFIGWVQQKKDKLLGIKTIPGGPNG